jgi:hypothetical protein
MLSFLIVMLVAAAVLAFVAWPLRAGAPEPGNGGIDPRLYVERDRALLAKERKLDEIRELRTDRQTGKLAKADAAVLERQLRAEAADLLHALDRAEAAITEATGTTAEPAADTHRPNAPATPQTPSTTKQTDGAPTRTPEPLP